MVQRLAVRTRLARGRYKGRTPGRSCKVRLACVSRASTPTNQVEAAPNSTARSPAAMWRHALRLHLALLSNSTKPTAAARGLTTDSQPKPIMQRRIAILFPLMRSDDERHTVCEILSRSCRPIRPTRRRACIAAPHPCTAGPAIYLVFCSCVHLA